MKLPRRAFVAWVGCFVTLIVFDLLWCTIVGYRALGMPLTYVSAATLSLILALPSLLSRRWWWQALLLAIFDIWLIANLMYCRTYFEEIPPASYLLGGNVADFSDAIFFSLSWADILIPLASAITIWLAYRRKSTPNPAGIKTYMLSIATGILGIFLLSIPEGGIRQYIHNLKQECYLHSTPPVIYTLPVSLTVDLLQNKESVSPQKIAETRLWLERAKCLANSVNHSPLLAGTYPREEADPQNVIFILVESLEAWPIGKTVEGKEITPNLNRIIADSANVWYGRRVLSQVGAGRSIDGQLLMTTGLYPPVGKVFSMLYPQHSYPHPVKLFPNSAIVSGDRAATWNEGVMSRQFGFREQRFRDAWDCSETFGRPRNPTDGSLLRQVADFIPSLPTPYFLEVITYSTHSPFRIPEQFRKTELSESYPAPLADYLYAVNYTDSALGDFIDTLRQRPDWHNTMIVVVGDHEGLASWRTQIRDESETLSQLVDADSFVPLIVINGRYCGRRDDVMGQIDVYSTILDQLGYDSHPTPENSTLFPGLGFSALRDASPRCAIAPNGQLIGDTANTSPELLEHLRQAPGHSATIIQADLLNSPL